MFENWGNAEEELRNAGRVLKISFEFLGFIVFSFGFCLFYEVINFFWG